MKAVALTVLHWTFFFATLAAFVGIFVAFCQEEPAYGVLLIFGSMLLAFVTVKIGQIQEGGFEGYDNYPEDPPRNT